MHYVSPAMFNLEEEGYSVVAHKSMYCSEGHV